MSSQSDTVGIPNLYGMQGEEKGRKNGKRGWRAVEEMERELG